MSSAASHEMIDRRETLIQMSEFGLRQAEVFWPVTKHDLRLQNSLPIIVACIGVIGRVAGLVGNWRAA
jgi:hypothetical protein